MENYAKIDQQIKMQQRLLGLLKEKAELLETDHRVSERYEKIICEIDLIKTLSEIDVVEKVLKEKQDYQKRFLENFKKEVDLMNQDFDNVLVVANRLSSKNESLAKILKDANMQEVLNDDEVRLKFYKIIKPFVSE